MNESGHSAAQVRLAQKIASRRGGCTNQIPLTIKPYPMKIQI